MLHSRAQALAVLITLVYSFISAAQIPERNPYFATEGIAYSLHPEIQDPGLTENQQRLLHPYLQSLLISARESNPDGLTFAQSTADEAILHLIVHIDDPGMLRKTGIEVGSAFDRFATVRVSVSELARLADAPGIRYVEPGLIAHPTMDVSLALTGAHLLHAGVIDQLEIIGEGVIVAVYDTGIDWSHPDFLDPVDPLKSRIISIWDQTLDPEGPESSPQGFSYGVEYTREQIEAELRGSPSTPVRSRDTNGHGTHVASIAAGSGGPFSGVAPGAELVIIKGSSSTYAEPRIIDGVTYVQRIAEQFRRPVVLNMSLGGYSGPRDGTSALELKVDDFSKRRGHVVVASAGNAGHVNMHRSGYVARGAVERFTVDVPSYTPHAGAENDILNVDIWLDGDAGVAARVITPGGTSVTRRPGDIGVHANDSEGTIEFFNVVNGINGHRQIMLRVIDKHANRPPASGRWTLELFDAERDARYDAWLPTLAIGSSRSMISMEGAGNTSTISMPASSRSVLSVGAYVSKQSWIDENGNLRTDNSGRDLGLAAYSSRGPTRDGRIKPEITAPGDWIAAARSSTSSYGMRTRGLHYSLSRGTSAAAPHVAGAAALLLSHVPNTGINQLRDVIIAGASDSGISAPLPDNDWGYGRLDAFDAMTRILKRDLSPERTLMKYDRHPTRRFQLTYDQPLAVRHSATTSGSLAAAMVHVASVDGSVGNLAVTVFEDRDGEPAGRLGAEVQVPLEDLFEEAFNIITLYGADISVSADADYYVVLSLTDPGESIQVFGDDGPGERSLRREGAWRRIGNNLAIRSETVTPLAPTSLPIELAHFTGRADASNAVLTWATSGENSNHGFEIQREADLGFERIAFVEGGGTTSETREYAYTVTDLSPGLQRFRLKQIDFDGNASYSPVAEVVIDMPDRYYLTSAYPNPFNPSTSVSLTLARSEQVRIDVYNALGQRVETLHNGLIPGEENHVFRFDAAALPSGLYVLSFEGESFHDVRRVILAK